MYHLLVLYGVIRYTICMENKYTHARTGVYNINYHIVWCVKYRRKVLSADISNRLIELLKAVGRTNIPVLLKRGLSATLEELVPAACGRGRAGMAALAVGFAVMMALDVALG